MTDTPTAPPFWRWLLGVVFIGRPIGWTFEQYDSWLVGTVTR